MQSLSPPTFLPLPLPNLFPLTLLPLTPPQSTYLQIHFLPNLHHNQTDTQQTCRQTSVTPVLAGEDSTPQDLLRTRSLFLRIFPTLFTAAFMLATLRIWHSWPLPSPATLSSRTYWQTCTHGLIIRLFVPKCNQLLVY